MISYIEKTCTKCGEKKSLSAFLKNPGGLHGRRGDCKSCKNRWEREARLADPDGWLLRRRKKHATEMRNWYRNNPDKAESLHRSQVLKRHGMDEHVFNAMLFCQSGCCAICGANKPGGRGSLGRFHIDHCHSTGKVRGLLCWKCNVMLGNAKDSTQTLNAAIGYLNKHKPQEVRAA